MRKFLLLALVATLAGRVMAQSCGCNVTIAKEGSYDGSYLGIKPGQTICLQAGKYSNFYFKNMIGTASAPIKIINCGGQVTVSSDTYPSGIQFYDSKYIKLTGTGDTHYAYGIRVTKTPASYSGIVVTGFSSDFEIEKVEVSGTGFAGIMVKNDPTCDPATWRENFSMRNIKIHGNYVHDTGGEGLYVGNSFWNSGMVRTCDGVSKTVFPHNIYGLSMYRNIVERTGAEGIQYGCAPDALVSFNTVRTTGVSPFDAYQNNGIQVGGGTGGRLNNNTIQDVPGTGIIIIGHIGNNMVFNNLVINTGMSGVFCDNREGTLANRSVIFANNTLVNCGTEGFRLYNELDLTTLANNAVIGAGSHKLTLTAPGVRLTQLNNYFSSLLNNALSAGVVQADYKPKPGSILVDRGITNTSWGITYDLDGKPRPQGKGVDIGAYELTLSVGRMAAEEVSEEERSTNEVPELNAVAYPSPCVGEVSIRLSNGASIVELSLYNTQGVRVEHLVPRQASDQIRLSTNTLAGGGYLFHIITSDYRPVTGRFVKQ